MKTAYEDFHGPIRVKVTPDLATEWLKLNEPGEYDKNRSLRWNDIDHYADQMRKGKWRLTHQGIAFRKGDGKLIDGQHRLWAVIQADTTVEMLVTFGLDKETRSVVDSGLKRTPGDILAMMGEKDPNALAGAVRLVTLYEERFKVPNRKLSGEELVERFREHDDLRNWVAVGKSLVRETGMTISPAIACAYLANMDPATEWMRGLLTGADLYEGDPRRALTRVITNAIKLKRTRPTEWQMGLFGKAFLLWQQNGKIRNLVFRDDEEMPQFHRIDLPRFQPQRNG